MKKVLSFICAITMIFSMMAFVTVSANSGTASVTTEYVDLSSLSTKYHYVGVKVTYTVPETLDGKSSYENEEEDMIYSGTALNGMFVEFSIDKAYTYMENKSVDIMAGLAANYTDGTMTMMFSPQTEDAYYSGSNVINLGTFAFRVSSETEVAESPITVNMTGGLTYSTMTYSGTNKLTKTPASYTSSKGQISYNGGTIPAHTIASADPVVTYEGEENLVWGAQGAYADGKATFSVKPVMGYTVAVTANGTEVAIDAAKGGEVTIDVTEDTTVVATATAITDAAYTYNEKYVDESGVVYVFGKATAAPFGFYLEKDGAALKNKALEIYDGKFEANGTAGAFGMSFAFTGEGHTGAYTAAVYDANGVADSSVAFNID